jgi:hypothetical protein
VLEVVFRSLEGPGAPASPRRVAMASSSFTRCPCELECHLACWHGQIVVNRYDVHCHRARLWRFRPCSPDAGADELGKRGRRHTEYRRFATAAEAIGYAVEELRALRSLTAWMQVDDERFSSEEIQTLYAAGDYPLRKPE